MKWLFLLLTACSVHTNRPKLPGLDAHMHVHQQDIEDDLKFTGERALFAANSIDIKRAIILSNAYSKNATEEYAKTQNDFVINEAKKMPTRLAAACAVNPTKSWAQEEMKRCHFLGVKVLKLHTMAAGMDLKTKEDQAYLEAILKLASELQFTVLIHGNFPVARRGNEAQLLLQELEKFPELKVILGHLLGLEFHHLENFHHPHYWVEISAAPVMVKELSQQEALVKTMRKIGLNRFIFGSDWPVIHPAETLKALQELPLSSSEIYDIQFSHAESLSYLFNAP